ncbi:MULTISPECIES: ribonuclease domain-containing protein [unclassified Streptomyces]|uniref:ribonuclease domain-containing protein n=1 Tax=unclassified Streptomyces TaxID=2593676 RepID=UPI001369F452|nr:MULTISPECIES: ribonuclease domain-containing protein [unclassified Streptomyces]MCW5253209.1 ribonuclease [Streptomyces sp. SHP 1-2]MYU26093.1 ribonuclease [Streptomyces sp. SID8352]
MRFRLPSRAARSGVLAALVPALLVGGCSVSPDPDGTAARPAETGAVGRVCYGDLPAQAHDTLRLIERGGPYPYSQDGTVFRNREGVLPGHAVGYYHEYTVRTPGSRTRGARRVVTGDGHREEYYTADHYTSFARVDRSC